jgi:hypothetical protein
VGVSGIQSEFRFSSSTSTFFFKTNWAVTRDGEMTLLSGVFEFPLQLLMSLSNRNLGGYGSDLPEANAGGVEVITSVKIKSGKDFSTSLIRGSYGIRQIWGDWFAKSQGLHTADCNPSEPNKYPKKPVYTSKILEVALSSTVEITINDPEGCIFLIHSGPLMSIKNLNKYNHDNYGKFQAEYPFWHGESAPYFDSILKAPTNIVQVGLNTEFEAIPINDSFGTSTVYPIKKLPSKLISHSDSVKRINDQIIITSNIDTSELNATQGNVVLYIGSYSWFTKKSTYGFGGWRITSQGSWISASYFKGGYLPGGWFPYFYTKAISIPSSELTPSSQQRAAAELKAKQEADAKAKAAAEAQAAAELKAKQEAEAKAAAELKAKQEAEAKAAAELKAKQEADAKAAAELKAKQEADAKAAAELKAKQEADAKAAAAIAAAKKKTTITCVKGKLTKKVTAVKPKCPTGYKLKK